MPTTNLAHTHSQIAQRIQQIPKEQLDALDTTWAEPCLDAHTSRYFHLHAGVDHYRLLIQLSQLYQNQLILDVGTFHGASALALSACTDTRVISFDLENHRQVPIERPNLEFRLEDVLASPDLIAEAGLILLDTFHDGPFEHHFYQKLQQIGFSGALLLDDIYLNEPMQSFWRSIRLPKADLTHLGHWSGTGAVFFNQRH